MAIPKNRSKLDGRPGLAAMVPRFLTTSHRVRETADVTTIECSKKDASAAPKGFKPGQFNMLYVFGVGEVPISISGDPADADRIIHTIRAVGSVSEALTELKPNQPVGVRGPYGSSWPVSEARGDDVLLVAGGIGLAPLRPALYHLLGNRQEYGHVALLYGARSPADLLYRQELDNWRHRVDLQVRVTVDRAGSDWLGDVGVVTKQLAKVQLDPSRATAMICGPEVMIRFTAAALEQMGLATERIHVSLERNMKCAIGLCGHCQFGPHFICKDGPVFRFDRVRDILSLREM